MSSDNPNLHKRRSIRLKGYDYAQAGLYFITLCVQDRQHLFGEIIAGKMHLNKLGKIAMQEWIATESIRKNCTLGAFIIMPNHFHAIISIDYAIKKSENIGKFKSPSQTIGAIIRGYKGATTKKIKEKIRFDNKEFDPKKKGSDPKGKGFDPKGKGFDPSTGELQFAPTVAPTAAPREGSIWQRNYYEHIIRNDKAFKNIENYIINNALKWEEDKFNKHD